MSATSRAMREPGEDAPEERPLLRVWSFDVPTSARNAGFAQKMPAGARVLRVAKVQSLVKLWVLVNSGMPEEDRFFYVARTNSGLPSPDDHWKSIEYVGSWVEPTEVWHVFEATAAK
jgi:hypothetical protein